MKKKVFVSTPSRICLFGEHQDYLRLEVIAVAINLRFCAIISSRNDRILRITTSGGKFVKLADTENNWGYNETIIDLSKPIVYENKRDYLKSTVNVLKKYGYVFEHGFDIHLDSEIPIGKGMSSSTTMIIVLTKALLEALNAEDKDNAEKIARLGFEAEVLEFKEPGGMMDHYSSALGGLVHLNFEKEETSIERIERTIPGCFILFDSKEEKDTTRVLANAKTPVVDGLAKLSRYGISSIKDFAVDEDKIKYLSKVDSIEKVNILANIDNYKILKKAEAMLKHEEFNPECFGELLKRHHANLRDGLKISTDTIELILNTAYENGALGGKINGSGGGGCAYVYSMEKDADRILEAVEALGFKGCIIKQDTGVRKDKEDIGE
jgi:galactokinase